MTSQQTIFILSIPILRADFQSKVLYSLEIGICSCSYSVRKSCQHVDGPFSRQVYVQRSDGVAD